MFYGGGVTRKNGVVCAKLHDGTVVVICYNSYGYQLLPTRRHTQNLLNGVGELDREISGREREE